MTNGWTGGQYSIYRVAAGVYLLIRFVLLMPDLVAVAAAAASLFFIIGLQDRIAAIAMAAALVFLSGPANPLVWLLVAHALLPPAPFWSFAARGRVDPRGNWSMPKWLFAAAWIATSLFYAWLGYTKWHALLLYAPLALIRPARPWIWLAMLPVLAIVVRDPDLIIVHLFTFDPAWIPRRDAAATDRVLYDGTCGLCHRSVRLLIAEDTTGASFVYAAQEGGGATVIVETADGRTLTKSDAVIRLLHRLGGLWRVIGILFALVPRLIRDFGYDFVARVRYRIFGRTKDACPLMPPDLRSRFM
jgi:predicted DCC family thiol-disulfide oxidoreductase YuxK